MDKLERIVRWFSQTSFYQEFCVNLPVPFNNAYFDVVFLMALGVIVFWTAADRIHSLRFRMRVRRKKESALEKQLEQEAKEQERKNQIEAINQNNLLYMQFLQTAMLSHMAISESAFEMWKKENGFVSLEQAKPEIEPDPETISEDAGKAYRNKADKNGANRNKIAGNEAEKNGAGEKVVGKNGREEKEAGAVGEETADAEIKDTEERGEQEKRENLQKSGMTERPEKQSAECERKKTPGQGKTDPVIECTDIEQDLSDVPDIELPILIEDEGCLCMDSVEEKHCERMLSFDELFPDIDDENVNNDSNEENGSNADNSDSGDNNNRCEDRNAANGIPEKQSTFDLLMENMIKMEADRKKQSSMQEEADKVISHNISVLDGQIQSALRVEEVADEDMEESGEVRQLKALEAERKRIEKEGSRKRFWRKKDGD